MIQYKPSVGDLDIINRVYDNFKDAETLRNQRWRYFNDRTLVEFINDSELRYNGFVPTREEQGKETWQANVFLPTTRNKNDAILAGIALEVPRNKIVARNENNDISNSAAYIVKNLVEDSFNKENQVVNNFLQAHECSIKGTVIVHDGYVRTTQKRRIIKDYNIETGEYTFETKEVKIDEGCTDFSIPLENVYIADFFEPNIQKQEYLIWVDYLTEDAFQYQFGKFKKSKFVKTHNQLLENADTANATFFYEKWRNRFNTQSKDAEIQYEVIRYYNKFKDEQIIVANGVLLTDPPLLLGQTKKYYPFSKSVYKIFGKFFYGNSQPNSMMGEQDAINSLYNMMLDKTYKTLVPSLLIGNSNKDDFDLEDESITLDTKIYVQDIEQVKEMPIKGISNSDIQMMNISSKGLDQSSVDANQQGVANRGVTAREIVIANENARKLKGVFFMFISDLWMQKIKIRILNLLTYQSPEEVMVTIGEKQVKKFKKIILENAELSDGTRGKLGITIVKDKADVLDTKILDANEEDHTAKTGEKNYEELSYTKNFIDSWEFMVKILPDSIFQDESSLSIAKVESKLKIIGAAFPEMFQLNKEKLFKNTITSLGDDPDEYQTKIPEKEQPAENIGNGEEAPVPIEGEVKQPPVDPNQLPPL